MNSKAKQRTASTGIGRLEPGPEPLPAPSAARAVGTVTPQAGARELLPDEGDLGKRLDRFLAERLADFAGLSRTRMQALVANGHVSVGGRLETQASLRLASTAAVVVDLPVAAPAEPVGQNLPLTVVFEDEHLLVLDKPAGLVVHPAAGHEDGTLVNALIAHCGDSLSGIGGVRRPGIVHRLDKDTTGLMVVAKTDAAHRGLADLFADHGRSGSLEREYLAIVWGRLDSPLGTINLPLGRHHHDRMKVAVVPHGRGKDAVTHWQVEAHHGLIASTLRCRLETGRTHQIRVHLTSLGHPLIGDPVYGVGYRTKAARLPQAAQTAIQMLGRQALHATTLGFDHPITGETLGFDSPLPDDLATLSAELDRAATPADLRTS